MEKSFTEPSLNDNVKRTEEKTERVSEFDVNSNFQEYFKVDKAKIAAISTMKMLSDIWSSVETMNVLANSGVSKDVFFDAILLKRNIIFS